VLKELLARRLLSAVIGKEELDPETASIADHLIALSAVKYDDYGGYSPGVKFLESLAVWLAGFDQSDRDIALKFVLKRLAYISAAELDHLVGTVYWDVLRPRFIRSTAESLGLPVWKVAEVTSTKEFQSIQRRTLILGMSDGARLDKLRRSSTLSTEQFHLVSYVDDEKQKDLQKKLRKALVGLDPSAPANFNQVVVVDDFSASGTTMLRFEEPEEGAEGATGAWAGKLAKLRLHVDTLKERSIVSNDASVLVLLYLMSYEAHSKLEARMKEAGFGDEYELIAVHKFSEDFALDSTRDAEFWNLCDRYFREAWKNEHTEIAGDFRFGYGNSALPLILHHNAPNNAPPILWKDESPIETGKSRRWVGVFPRHERHHPGRP
jgi:hypothetical protein